MRIQVFFAHHITEINLEGKGSNILYKMPIDFYHWAPAGKINTSLMSARWRSLSRGGFTSLFVCGYSSSSSESSASLPETPSSSSQLRAITASAPAERTRRRSASPQIVNRWANPAIRHRRRVCQVSNVSCRPSVRSHANKQTVRRLKTHSRHMFALCYCQKRNRNIKNVVFTATLSDTGANMRIFQSNYTTCAAVHDICGLKVLHPLPFKQRSIIVWLPDRLK